MRIKSILLSWFRGAASSVSLELLCKSMVVYGSNGSGKSCFVDAVDYVINNGKIGHLTHEYSGRKQEKAVPNTHTPPDQKTSLTITFKDGTKHTANIAKDGSCSSKVASAAAMHSWEYHRTVLRQHEVVEFIQATKGAKYSALLPLLGLHPIEVAAENLRNLARSVEDESKLIEQKTKLQQVETRRKEVFGTETEEQIFTKVEQLYKKYCPGKEISADQMTRCKDLKAEIDTRIAASSDDLRRHLALVEAAAIDLNSHIQAVRTANATLTDSIEPLIKEKLEVLQSTVTYMDRIEEVMEVDCPACGRSIPIDEFKSHLIAEQDRLRSIIITFNARKAALGTLCDTVKALQATFRKSDTKSWREEIAKGPLGKNFDYLDQTETERLRVSCGEDELRGLEDNLQPLINAAAFATKDVPPDARELLTHKQTIEVATDTLDAKTLDAAIKRVEELIRFIKTLEQDARDEIRAQARTVIDDISKDIQEMWAMLHPDEPIDEVQLYLPNDSDKAIDIGLKFHGVKQDSPRLTLSEGYRNSLGLCVFLAMAMREATSDKPVFLDDVVVSFDREHRGQIAEVLAKKFSTRQIVILTHDRDWFTDLRAQLDGSNWNFAVLLPFDTPEIGIRWSHKTDTLDDARAYLEDAPDIAGNNARKIMDSNLAIVAERLQLQMPFVRGDKNDKRMAHDFLERLISDGKKCFQKNTDGKFTDYLEGIDALKAADRLLVTWGNRASHDLDVAKTEATKLIDMCEKALACFQCSHCNKPTWFADAANKEYVQCHCGKLRWRYGSG